MLTIMLVAELFESLEPLEALEPPAAVVVAAAAPPPKPLYTTPPSDAVDAAAPALVLVDDMVVIVLVLTLVGLVAPQGWFWVHAAAHVLSFPQADTQSVLY